MTPDADDSVSDLLQPPRVAIVNDNKTIMRRFIHSSILLLQTRRHSVGPTVSLTRRMGRTMGLTGLAKEIQDRQVEFCRFTPVLF
jgi:hypothetical protein